MSLHHIYDRTGCQSLHFVLDITAKTIKIILQN